MTKKVEIGAVAQFGGRRYQVIAPCKIPGHWVCKIIADLDHPGEVGTTRIQPGGSIAFNRIRDRRAE